MRRSTDFTTVVRVGLRVRAGRVVVHHARTLDNAKTVDDDKTLDDAKTVDDAQPATVALVGFVVSKAVGNSVQRHAVTRRLRAQVADRLQALPAGSGTVVRALPASTTATSHELGRDLDRALSRLAASPERARSNAGAR